MDIFSWIDDMEPLNLTVGKTDAVQRVAQARGFTGINPWAEDVAGLIERFGDGPSGMKNALNFRNSSELGLKERLVFGAVDQRMASPTHLTVRPDCFPPQGFHVAHSPQMNVLQIPKGVICHFSEMALIFSEGLEFVISNYSSKYSGITKFYDFSREQILENTRHIDGTVLVLIDDISPPNFCHWLIDLLPRLAVMANQITDSNFYVATRHLTSPYQIRSLEMCGISSDRVIQLGPYESVSAENLIVTSDIAHMPHPCFKVAPWAINFLRSKILAECFVAPDAAWSGSSYHKIYISRGDAPGRKIVNDSEFSQYLEGHGYTRVVLSDLSLSDQVKIVSNSSSIIGLHGAGLSHLVFAKKDCQIIEIFPHSYGTPAFHLLAAVNGNRYFTYVVDDIVSGSRSQVDDIFLDIEKFKDISGSLL